MKVILFGSTDMVGQGALRECRFDPEVGSVLAIVRRPSGLRDPKVRESRAMLVVAKQGAPKRVLENRDIVALAP